jgi:hypothetical protein
MNRLFFAQMGVSSALALVRGFIVAQLLSPGAFGSYALLLAIGMFGANVLGFGHIERTFKRFPRLFIDGRADDALREADGINRLLLWRGLGLALIAIALMAAIGQAGWIGGALCAVGMAWAVAVQSTYISVHRSSAELAPLGNAALIRSVMALAFAAAGATLASWSGAMIGEIVAAVIGGWISRALAKRTVGRMAAVPERPLEPAGKELWLFFAFAVAAIPFYLDRAVVSLLFGNVATGTYGLLMLFVSGSAALTAVVCQKLGPQLVRLERSGARFRDQLRPLGLWMAAIVALTLAGMVTVGVLLLHGPLAPLGMKYGLTDALLAAAAVVCAGQVAHMIEWSLLSHDRERSVFLAAILYVAVLAIGVGLVAETGAGLLAFIWAVAVGKLFHLAVLVVLLLWNRRQFVLRAVGGSG